MFSVSFFCLFLLMIPAAGRPLRRPRFLKIRIFMQGRGFSGGNLRGAAEKAAPAGLFPSAGRFSRRGRGINGERQRAFPSFAFRSVHVPLGLSPGRPFFEARWPWGTIHVFAYMLMATSSFSQSSTVTVNSMGPPRMSSPPMPGVTSVMPVPSLPGFTGFGSIFPAPPSGPQKVRV